MFSASRPPSCLPSVENRTAAFLALTHDPRRNSLRAMKLVDEPLSVTDPKVLELVRAGSVARPTRFA